MNPLSISTCWNASRHTEGEPMLEELREMGFTHAEIGHGLPFSKWPGIKDAVQKKVIQLSSLHNFCPQPIEFGNSSPNYFQFSDDRQSERLAAVRHTILTIENAAELGAKAVVLHLGWAGPRGISKKLLEIYREGGFLKRGFINEKIQAVQFRRKISSEVMNRVKKSLEKIVETAQHHQIKLGFEIRESFEEFPCEMEMAALLDEYPPEVVGYWHDFGHAARKHFMTWHTHEETLLLRRARLIGCHVHDCRAPADDHLPLGEGETDFPALLRHLPVDYLPVLEMNPDVTREEIIKSKQIWNSYVSK